MRGLSLLAINAAIIQCMKCIKLVKLSKGISLTDGQCGISI